MRWGGGVPNRVPACMKERWYTEWSMSGQSTLEQNKSTHATISWQPAPGRALTRILQPFDAEMGVGTALLFARPAVSIA